MEVRQEIEDDVRLEGLHSLAQLGEVLAHPDHEHLVPQAAEGRQHVVLGLPFMDDLLTEALGGVGRHELGVHHQDHALLFHR
jgi:hypothetical protein